MYCKYQIYQRFYLLFMIVASLLFAGAPQVVASQAFGRAQKSSKKEQSKLNAWNVCIAGGVTLLLGGVVLYLGINNKGTEENDNDTTGGGNNANKVMIEGDTSLIGDYVFISDDKGKNKSFMATIYMAWRKLRERFYKGEKLEIELGSPKNEENAKEMVNHINDKTNEEFKEQDWYLVLAGYLPMLIKKYNEMVMKKFKNKSLTLNEKDYNYEGIAAIAAADIKFNFDPVFKKTDLKLNKEGKTVEAFGCQKGDTDLAKNVKEVMDDRKMFSDDYKNRFIIELVTTNKTFYVFFIHGFGDNLGGAMEEINNYVEKGRKDNKEPNQRVELKIPKLNGVIESHFDDIFRGATIKGKNGKNDGQFKLYQKISISLDETGGSMDSVAVASAAKGMDDTKKYVFDEQFYMVAVPKEPIFRSKEKNRAAFILNVNGLDFMTEVK